MDFLSFPAILMYLTAYFVVETGVKKAYQHAYPEFYQKLYADRKDNQYFVFIMGFLLALVSTPICFMAFQESANQNDVMGAPNLSTNGKLCMAMKGVLWTSELNRLDHSVRYMKHHLATIVHLVYHLHNKMPLRIVYGFYTSLVKELISDTACLLTLHDLTPETSSTAYRLQVINFVALACIRIPPCVYAISFITQWQPISNPLFWVNLLGIFIYTRFIVTIIISISKRAQIVQFVSSKPAHLRVFQTYHFSIYSIFFALASFLGAVLTSKIYTQASPIVLDGTKSSLLNIQILLTGASSLVRAQLPPILIQKAKFSLWIQGSILAASLSVLPSPFTDRYRLFSSLAIALPFSEAVGRIGCHFAGCCGSNWPVQLCSCALNSCLGLAVITSYQLGIISLEQAALISLGVNAGIRIMLRWNWFAFSQLTAAVGMLGFSCSRASESLSGTVMSPWEASYDLFAVVKFDIAWMVVFSMSAIAAAYSVRSSFSPVDKCQISLARVPAKKDHTV